MTMRDPKTGRFVKGEDYEDDYQKYWDEAKKLILTEPPTKTPTNYWNYILLGIFGIISGIIGYGLAQF